MTLAVGAKLGPYEILAPLGTRAWAKSSACGIRDTNVRAVPDAKSPNGWKLEAGRFPGWQNTPHW
jgi:hypothetical protein